MRHKLGNVLWGLIFIALGLGFAGNFLLDWNLTLFFRGWWTLFIIVPCLISIIQNGVNTGAVLGLIFGGMLFLQQNNYMSFYTVRHLIVPVILVAIGIKLIFRNNFARKVEQHTQYHRYAKSTVDGSTVEADTIGNDSTQNGQKTYQSGSANGFQTGAEYSAFFSSNRAAFDGEVFTGTSANAIFGGVVIDLRGAIIDQDVVINATAIFGGIDIYVPYGVKVKVNNVPIFGGVSNKTGNHANPDAPTIYLQSTCMFGGIDIK